MKISVDHVTNSSSESFGTVIIDTAAVIGLSIPYIAATLGQSGKGSAVDGEIPEDDWGYEPYESTDPNDEPGTIVQNNRDGTVTKTLPDGSVGTQMKDGTIYVTQPDGTTGVIEPDGHQKMTLPDGTKIEQYTDGTAYAEYPDGTKRTEYEDGTIREQDPDGEIVQMNTDGSFEVTEPNERFSKVYSEDGEILGAKDSNGSDIRIDSEGNISGKIINELGEETKITGDNSTGYRIEDEHGNFAEMDEDFNIKSLSAKDENIFLEIKDNGALKAAMKNPETGESFELDVDPEKGTKYKDSDGNYIDVDSEGRGRAYIKKGDVEAKINEDGSMSYKEKGIEMYADGKGRVDVKDQKGNYEVYQENEDGSMNYEAGDESGVKVTGVKDVEGNYELNTTDGSQVIIGEDALTIRDAEGKTTIYTKKDIDKMVVEQGENSGEVKEDD